MKLSKIRIAVIFFLLITLNLSITSAQEQLPKIEGVKAMENEANGLYDEDNYKEALPYYLLLDSIKPNNAHFKARTGVCYLNLATKFKALAYLEEAKKMGHNKDGIDYYLGGAYHLKHDFDNAITHYTAYKDHLHKSTKKLKEIKELEVLIAQCNTGKLLVKNEVAATIENLGSSVNSTFTDFAPLISADEGTLIFSSKRPNSGKRDENLDYYEDLYISYKDGDKWSTPKNLGPPINTKVNDASCGLSVDGQQLFLYKNDTLDTDKSGGDIYESDLKNGKWTKPRRMANGINSSSWEPSASLISDENTMFFSSNRPGGFGGLDIYVCHRDPKTKVWGTPKNVGANINSEFDEDAPFIHPDSKTLYFSSNSKMSMGGFDIFTSDFDKATDSVSVAQNIGYPINTADNELYFVWSADGKRGYFSSARSDSYGEEDLYIVYRPNVKVDLVLFNGKIKSNNKTLPAQITIIDNETNKVVAFYDSTSFSGEYTITLEPGKNYAVSIESGKFLSHSENIIAPIHGFTKIEKNVEMTPLDKGGLIVLNNVYFEQGKSEVRKESYGELDRYTAILKAKPDLLMEIASHAGDFGDDHASNMELSQKRAEAVVAYLISKGVGKDKLRAMGYGDKFNLADNSTEDGKKLNTRTELIIYHNLKQGKAPVSDGFYNDLAKTTDDNGLNAVLKLRRETTLANGAQVAELTKQYLTEQENNVYLPGNATDEQKAKVIEEKVKKGSLKLVVMKGRVTDINTNKPMIASLKMINAENKVIAEVKTSADGTYQIKTNFETEKSCILSVQKDGYNFANKSFFVPANSDEKIEIVNDFFLKKLEAGTKFILRNIYYNFNMTSLRSESLHEIDQLENMMRKNPNVIIEVAGHTDAKGTDYYNKILSQRRAQSVVDHLVSKGVPRGRLIAKGYGEEKPLASNDDELEGRELNRRTEIQILKNSK